VNPRHARVPDARHAVAHRLGRERGLLGHGDVARPGGDDADLARAQLRAVAPDADEARRLVPLGVRADVTDFAERLGVRARHQHVRGARDEPLDDVADLRARLPGPEDDFRETLPRGARVIHTRVLDVLEVQVGEAARRRVGL
jgi:hypothetical protein